METRVSAVSNKLIVKRRKTAIVKKNKILLI